MAAETPKSLRTNFENLEVYKLAERLADEIWSVVGSWDHFSKGTIGRQVVRAADSIGANIAEGVGRGSYQDNRRFVRTARGSLNETKHWLRRAHSRRLLSPESVNTIKPLVDALAPKLNAYLRSIGRVPTASPRDNGALATDHGQLTTDN